MSRYATTKADVYYLAAVICFAAEVRGWWLFVAACVAQEVVEWRHDARRAKAAQR